mmetsp:Transcript_49161/g.117205  ORF Transcript_49161/g.117205 Transcript_49161/m.117205 type:complete len:236 (+) Transcript_49161:592-1299(+)
MPSTHGLPWRCHGGRNGYGQLCCGSGVLRAAVISCQLLRGNYPERCHHHTGHSQVARCGAKKELCLGRGKSYSWLAHTPHKRGDGCVRHTHLFELLCVEHVHQHVGLLLLEFSENEQAVIHCTGHALGIRICTLLGIPAALPHQKVQRNCNFASRIRVDGPLLFALQLSDPEHIRPSLRSHYPLQRRLHCISNGCGTGHSGAITRRARKPAGCGVDLGDSLKDLCAACGVGRDHS